MKECPQLQPQSSDIERALRAFAPDTELGLQIFAADTLLARYHPPLQTTLPALIGGISDHGPTLATRLSIAYPAETPIQFLVAGENKPQTRTLAELATGNGVQDWWLLPARSADSSLPALVDLIAQLRAPAGCPWDRAQTHLSLRPYLLEETHEALEALDSGDMNALRDELGDVLLQILLHSQLATESGAFTIHEVLEQLARKLIRRHPHVWGDVSLDTPAAVRQTWEQLKREERGGEGAIRPTLAGLPPALPALLQAQRYQERAAHVGFDWEDAADVAAKVREELDELLAASPGPEREAEFGDLLFALVNWARWLGIADAESALRAANSRFARRFAHIESRLRDEGRLASEASLTEMDALWDDAKRHGL